MKRFLIAACGIFFIGCSDLDSPATAGGVSTYYSVMHYDPWYHDNGYYYDDIYVVDRYPDGYPNRPVNRPERPLRGEGERLRDRPRAGQLPSLPSRARPTNFSRPSGFSRGMGMRGGGRRR